MTTQQKPRPLYVNDNGEVACLEHGGSYLAASVQAYPRSRLHTTPLGTWELVSALLAESWARSFPGDPPLACETCAVTAVAAAAVTAGAVRVEDVPRHTLERIFTETTDLLRSQILAELDRRDAAPQSEGGSACG